MKFEALIYIRNFIANSVQPYWNVHLRKNTEKTVYLEALYMCGMGAYYMHCVYVHQKERVFLFFFFGVNLFFFCFGITAIGLFLCGLCF